MSYTFLYFCHWYFIAPVIRKDFEYSKGCHFLQEFSVWNEDICITRWVASIYMSPRFISFFQASKSQEKSDIYDSVIENAKELVAQIMHIFYFQNLPHENLWGIFDCPFVSKSLYEWSSKLISKIATLS